MANWRLEKCRGSAAVYTPALQAGLVCEQSCQTSRHCEAEQNCKNIAPALSPQLLPTGRPEALAAGNPCVLSLTHHEAS